MSAKEKMMDRSTFVEEVELALAQIRQVKTVRERRRAVDLLREIFEAWAMEWSG